VGDGSRSKVGGESGASEWAPGGDGSIVKFSKGLLVDESEQDNHESVAIAGGVEGRI